MGDTAPMASGHDTPTHDHGHDDPIQGHVAAPSHDAHDHDAHGHDDHHDAHGPTDDAWVLPPIVIGFIVAIIIVVIVGGTGSGASPFG